MNLQESARPTKAGKCLADELLIVCARTHLDPTHVGQLRRLAGSELDWSYLLAAAHRHGLLPLVGRHVREHCSEAGPLSWMNYLRVFLEKNARENFLLTSELLRIAARFAKDGVLAFSYKGPTLAAQVYGSLALRQMADLDWLVPHDALPPARDSLRALGYVPRFPEGRVQSNPGRRAPGQYGFTLDGGRCLVELHTERTLRYFPVPIDPARVASRSKLQRLGGRSVRVLAPEDQLLFLCVHGAKHFWERLGWICDIAELVRAQVDLDWDLTCEEADALGARRILRLGLTLARDVLDAELPRTVLQDLRSDAQAQSLAAQVRERLFLDGFAILGVLDRLRFRMRMRGNAWQGISYSFRLATTPSEERAQSVLLRSALRPAKLLREYGWGLQRSSTLFDLARYVPTPPFVVEQMLRLAEASATDVIYDLGCGDGRIVIRAVKKYGARGIGIEIDRELVERSRAQAKMEGVDHLVEFRQQDALTVDLAEATVVTLYMMPEFNAKLRPKLQKLKPGARVVSHDFGIEGWSPIRTEKVAGGDSYHTHTIYLWKLP